MARLVNSNTCNSINAYVNHIIQSFKAKLFYDIRFSYIQIMENNTLKQKNPWPYALPVIAFLIIVIIIPFLFNDLDSIIEYILLSFFVTVLIEILVIKIFGVPESKKKENARTLTSADLIQDEVFETSIKYETAMRKIAARVDTLMEEGIRNKMMKEKEQNNKKSLDDVIKDESKKIADAIHKNKIVENPTDLPKQDDSIY